jgi:hypothetical protein
MGFLVRLCLALLVALAVGVGSAWWMIASVPQTGFTANGAWRIAPRPVHGLYERAALARRDLLAPEPRDALTLTATTDETGAPLHGGCSYRIEGASLPAKGWSVAAYGPHQHLLPESAQPQTVTGGGAQAADGRIRLDVPAHPAASFTLTLRLYRPTRSALAAPGGFNAPRIVAEACR